LGQRKTQRGQFSIAPRQSKAAREKKDKKGQPEPCVAERPQQEEACDIEHERKKHHVAHVARPCRADEHPIEFISKNAKQRHQRGEHKIFACIGPHLRIGRKKSDEGIAEKKRGRCQASRKNEAPQRRQTHGSAKTLYVLRADGLPAHLLGRRRKAVEKIGRDENEVQQNCIGGELDIAAPGALRGKKREGKKQRRIADKNIAIDREHPGDLRGIENEPARHRKEIAPEVPCDEKPSERANNFGGERAGRRALHAERKPIYEADVEGDIAKIDQDLKGKRDIGAPAPDDRAHKGIIRKREGRRPDPDIEIKPARGGDFGRGGKRAKSDPGDRRLEANHDDADAQGNDQGAQEGCALLASILCPQGLRGEPRGSHPQETKTPKQKIENNRSCGDSAKQIRLAQSADHRRIGDSEQRRRQMRESHRQGEPCDAGVADQRRIYRAAFILGHRVAIRSAGVTHIHEPQNQPNGYDDRGSGKDIIADLPDGIET